MDSRDMIASERHVFPISEEEMVKLIHVCREPTDYVFGPGWSGLVWEKGERMPEAVYRLGQIRGVTNENMAGAGI